MRVRGRRRQTRRPSVAERCYHRMCTTEQLKNAFSNRQGLIITIRLSDMLQSYISSWKCVERVSSEESLSPCDASSGGGGGDRRETYPDVLKMQRKGTKCNYLLYKHRTRGNIDPGDIFKRKQLS